MFLDDTACNLASMNLLAFRDEKTKNFDIVGYEHAVRLWTMVLKYLGDDGAVPVQGDDRATLLRVPHPRLRLRQHRRPPDVVGIGYDSDAARAIGGALTRDHDRHQLRDLGGNGQGNWGPVPGFKKNREHMLRVIRNHRRAAYGEKNGYEKLATPPVRLDHATLSDNAVFFKGPVRTFQACLGPGTEARRRARLPQRPGNGRRADRHHRPRDGLRHHRHRARLPLVKFKKLAGGGYFKIINRAVRRRARARLLRERTSPRSRPMRSVTARSASRPASTTRP